MACQQTLPDNAFTENPLYENIPRELKILIVIPRFHRREKNIREWKGTSKPPAQLAWRICLDGYSLDNVFLWFNFFVLSDTSNTALKMKIRNANNILSMRCAWDKLLYWWKSITGLILHLCIKIILACSCEDISHRAGFRQRLFLGICQTGQRWICCWTISSRKERHSQEWILDWQEKARIRQYVP